jgi:hypothetical protein
MFFWQTERTVRHALKKIVLSWIASERIESSIICLLLFSGKVFNRTDKTKKILVKDKRSII